MTTTRPKARLPADIIEAITSPAWWGPWFPQPELWTAWHAYLKAVFALPMSAAEQAIYRQATGRTEVPAKPAREVFAPTGRRAGKTRIAATVAAYLAVFVDWRKHLAPGERASILLLGADRKQSRVALRYLRSLLMDHAGLATLVEGETAESISLANRVTLEVATSNFRVTRGYSVAAIIADEIAFWEGDESSANPADEVIAALRPAMAGMPGSLLMAISSPYARRGPLWNAYRRHFGKDGDPILVWQAPTKLMNWTIPAAVIAEAYEDDPASAAAEYGAQFRTDIESYIAREAVDACVSRGVFERGPIGGADYAAFVDPSGGSSDSMTLAIGHREGDERGVLDVIREVRPPFSPDAVVEEFAATLTAYGLHEVTGDRYAGEWPRERFRVHGVEYRGEAEERHLPGISSGPEQRPLRVVGSSAPGRAALWS